MEKFGKRQSFLNKFQKIIWDQMGVNLSIFKNKIKKRFGDAWRLILYRKSLRKPRPIFYKVEVMNTYKPKKKIKYIMRVYYEKLKYLFFYNKMKQNKMKLFLVNLKKKKVSLFKKFLYKFECRLDILLFKLGFIFNDFQTMLLFNKNAFCNINNFNVKKANYSLEIGDEVSFSFFWYLFLKNMYYLRFKKFRYQTKRERLSKLIKFQDLFLKLPNYIEFSFQLFELIMVRFPNKYDIFFSMKIDLRKILVLYNNIF